MAYPWSGPSVCRVCSTIRSRVPGRTSALVCCPLATPMEYHHCIGLSNGGRVRTGTTRELAVDWRRGRVNVSDAFSWPRYTSNDTTRAPSVPACAELHVRTGSSSAWSRGQQTTSRRAANGRPMESKAGDCSRSIGRRHSTGMVGGAAETLYGSRRDQPRLAGRVFQTTLSEHGLPVVASITVASSRFVRDNQSMVLESTRSVEPSARRFLSRRPVDHLQTFP
jgi:hypothetical protein